MTITSTPELGTWETQIEKGIAAGLDFILSHLKEPLWPRTISTKATEGRQVPVYRDNKHYLGTEQLIFLTAG